MSTGSPVDRPSGEVRGVWICGRRDSTACGRRDHPQGSRPLSTDRPQEDHCCTQGFHTPVHCSATKRPRSPRRVKGVTPRCRVGLWGTWVKLGTALGRSGPCLCTGCAELSAVHRRPCLSTASTHRPGGQKNGADLGKGSFPPFPQPLLLRPQSSSGEMVSKWVLCTTRPRTVARPSARLDPEPHRLSVACVRLVSGNSADERRQQGEPATSRRRFR